MQKRKSKNLFEIKTAKGRILFRHEDDGYCVYLCNEMKFYFLDKLTGVFFFNHLGQMSQNEVERAISNTLGYQVDSSLFHEIKKQYLEDLPSELSAIS